MRRVVLFLLTTVAALAVWTSLAQAQSASIRITKPVDRHNVPMGDVSVEVELTGVTPGDGTYWELYADALPVMTMRDGATSGTVNFKQTGPHPLEVVLFDRNGARLASQRILVIAAPVSPITPLFNRPVMAPFMAGFVLVVIGIILLGLRLRPRVST